MIERKFEPEMRMLLIPIAVDPRPRTFPTLSSARHTLFFVGCRRFDGRMCIFSFDSKEFTQVEDILFAIYCRVYEMGQWFEGDSERVFGLQTPVMLAAE